MKQLRIGIMGTRGVPNHYGGFEQFAGYLSAGLAERGHQVWVYNSVHHPYQQAEWNDVHLIHCRDPENRMGTAGQFLYDLHCIKDARKRLFDVLLHLGYTSDAIWYRRWPKQTMHMVNMDGLEWKRQKYNWLTRLYLKYAEKKAARHADVLVADSVAIQEYLQKAYGQSAAFIPYAANVFESPDENIVRESGLEPHAYFLLIARFVPENHLEMLIKGYLQTAQDLPLIIIGDYQNKLGRQLQKKYKHPGIIFKGSIYDMNKLDQLRYYSRIYFHGHSVGGTNPSLLEAMACGCQIAAHDNPFNKAVLGKEAHYFSNPEAVAAILEKEQDAVTIKNWKESNLEKIRTRYHPDRIIDAYEKLMLTACGQ